MSTIRAPESASIVRQLCGHGVIPVIELETAETGVPLLEALIEAGLPVSEVTLRSTAGLRAIGVLRASFPEALVGAGTVRSLADAARVIDEGAQFVVSPATNPKLMEFCLSRGVAVLPGACTPTEIDSALRSGASLVKFFPAEAMGGIAFLKALAGPFRDVRFVPTGGINANNLREYLSLPQVAACGGSWMVAPALVREHRFDKVRELTRQALAIVKEVRDRG
jgi:2-dehydro-3-deoxyphosphogluconate aldolase/(4S)-4-hydroxy-2-oxoglutarate aldolase